MTNTCVKTGVILETRNHHRFKEHLYGDLHIVGNCGIIYYPFAQHEWGAAHGWIDLGGRIFQRDVLPWAILVVDASCIYIRNSALHEFDRILFLGAGGQLINEVGEMGVHKK